MLKRIVALTLILFLGCGGRMATLVDPVNNENFIVVGTVILQNNQFTSETAVYTDGIDVLVTGKYEENGKEKKKDFWVITDRQGYFFLANVPPGQYALKALRTTVGIDRMLTIANSLRYSTSEFQIQPKERIPAGADYFEEQPVGRVVDLKHNFFMIDYASQSNYRVKHQKASSVPKAKLIDGQEITRPSVPAYFIEKFPTSKWISVLEQVKY